MVGGHHLAGLVDRRDGNRVVALEQHLDLTEPPSERDLLVGCEVLAREHQHRVAVEGLLDPPPLVLAEGGELHIGDDRAERRVERSDLHGDHACTTIRVAGQPNKATWVGGTGRARG